MQPTAVTVATPLNDQQLIALVAGLLAGTARERVELAVEIVAESVLRGSQALSKRILEEDPAFIERRKAMEDAAQRGLLVPGGPVPAKLLERNRQSH